MEWEDPSAAPAAPAVDASSCDSAGYPAEPVTKRARLASVSDTLAADYDAKRHLWHVQIHELENALAVANGRAASAEAMAGEYARQTEHQRVSRNEEGWRQVLDAKQQKLAQYSAKLHMHICVSELLQNEREKNRVFDTQVRSLIVDRTDARAEAANLSAAGRVGGNGFVVEP